MEPFIGEIRIFAGNFAPAGWAFCDGQLLAISQNDVLFSLFGTFYGGDGQTTFGLPDLRGRVPIHAGTGPGLSHRWLSDRGGTESETLSVNQMPNHGHTLRASADSGTDANPSGEVLAQSPTLGVYREGTPTQALSAAAVGTTGGNQAHTDMMPYLVVHFIVSLYGIYPSTT
jgi:microcystin-dependent protein